MKKQTPKTDSLFKRSGSPYWWIRRVVAYPGIGEIRISTRTTNRTLALKYDALVVEYRDHGKFEALAALKAGRVNLAELSSHREAGRLSTLMAERESPLLSPLVAEWLDTGAAATGIRDSSMRRYRSSWKHVERSGLVGKATRLSGIHQSFVSAFKAYRNREAVKALKQITNATLNRDLAAIGAFLTWCTDERGYKIERPKLKYLQESKGRMKWLTAEEVARFQQHCPSERWPLFALMMSTGLSIGEVLGLRVCDVDRNTMMISIHESGGRALKRRSRARNLIVSQRVMGWINEEMARGDGAPTSRIFPMTYWPWRKIWKRTCEKAQITEARMHDSRHTFAIHAVQNGVPESRLQSLLGHAHPGTTRRYAMFAPGQFAKEDMATVSESIGFEAAARRVAGPRMVNTEIPVDIIDQKVSATSQIPCSETLT